MSRLGPVHWCRLRCVFEAVGFRFRKGKGDHWVGEKPGVARPVVIPEYPDVGVDIIRANLRTAGLSREAYLDLLRKS